MFTVVVTEVNKDGVPEGVERYKQTVDVIDLPKLIAAINAKPRKPRAPKAK